jgi:hypothetical protein
MLDQLKSRQLQTLVGKASLGPRGRSNGHAGLHGQLPTVSLAPSVRPCCPVEGDSESDVRTCGRASTISKYCAHHHPQ